MRNPKISIIVPIYKVEQYLPSCIESILSQTFDDFELLLVDDGSPDHCGLICDAYAAKDSRIRVFHKPNGGVSSARNVGIENVHGEWVAFVDGDDVIPNDALDILFRLTSSDIDMVMAGYEKVDEYGSIMKGPPHIVNTTMTWEQALTEMFKATDYGYQGYCFSKLYRASRIKTNALRFCQDIKFNEDRLFVINFVCQSKKTVAYTTKSVYIYQLREGSAMGSLTKGYNQNFATEFDSFLMICDILEACTHNKKLRQYAKVGLCNSYKMNHKMMIKGNSYDKTIHGRMFRGLLQKGALLLYVKHVLRSFIGNIGLLFFPRLIAKVYRGGVILVDFKSQPTVSVAKLQTQCICIKLSDAHAPKERRVA